MSSTGGGHSGLGANNPRLPAHSATPSASLTSSTGQPAQQHYPQQQSACSMRCSSLIYDSELFLAKLREFKPQSLGCLEARRKSSSTLIFPSPQQACMGPPKCPKYPHGVKPTSGYWIECHGPGVLSRRQQIEAMQAQQQHASAALSAASQGPSRGINTPSSAVSIHEQPQVVQTPSSDVLQQKRYSAGARREALLAKPSLKLRNRNDTASFCGATQFIATTTTNTSTLSKSGRGVSETGTANSPLFVSAALQAAAERGVASEQAAAGSISSGQGTLRTLHKCLSLDKLASITLDSGNSDQVPSDAAEVDAQKQDTPNKPSQQTTEQHQMRRHERQESMSRKSSRGVARGGGKKMTRDDIDVRRGTPNITITEPSFNQSTSSSFYIDSQVSGSSGSGSGPANAEHSGASCGIDNQVSGSTGCGIPSSSQAQSSSRPESAGTGSTVSWRDEQVAGTSCETFVKSYKASDSATSSSVSSLASGKGGGSLSSHQQPSSSRIGGGVAPLAGSSSICRGGDDCGGRRRSSIMTTSCGEEVDDSRLRQAEMDCGNIDAGNEETCDFNNLELISFEEENYEKHYYGKEHWNYFTNDEMLGPVMLSLKQEVNNQRDHFHVLLRTVSYTLHGTIPASTICADRYDREAIVRELSEIAKLKPALMLGQLPSTPDELLKLDHMFIKSELKVGVIYIKEKQENSEEAILGNKDESPLFTEFLSILGSRVKLKGFDRYKGGLDTVHNLTGTESVYTCWRNIEIMFHVSTMLPHEDNDAQKLQKKRHIGNDIVCVAFLESGAKPEALFWPGCVKSYFLHTFIAVQTDPKPPPEGQARKYRVSCVCRNEVQHAFKPFLVEQDEFEANNFFREWLLTKIVNGERASYSAPKFARMQDRTRSQMLEDIITNLANHLVTGQIPKPYRRGSWRPLGHTRASSPLEDSMKDYFEDYDQLSKDFYNSFCGPSKSMLCDVVFKLKDKSGNPKLAHGVRAIMAIRSRIFLELLYGLSAAGSSAAATSSLQAIEMRALAGAGTDLAGTAGSSSTRPKGLLAKRGSVGPEMARRSGEKERRQSMLPNLSKSISQKPNYLTVPSNPGGAGTSGLLKNAFNRLVSGNWSGWSGNIRGYKSEGTHIKVDQKNTKVDLNNLALCKEIAKIDADRVSQRQFEIKEFDFETFQQTIEYIHNGQCKLSYETIPGLICAAEILTERSLKHYDLPDLLHACFHHANTHMKLSAAPLMMNELHESSCFYVTAMQLLNSIFEFIDANGSEFLQNESYYIQLNESVFTTMLARKSLQVNEIIKFKAMCQWANHRCQQNKAKQQQQQQQQQLHKQSNQTTTTTTTTGAMSPLSSQSNSDKFEASKRKNKLWDNKNNDQQQITRRSSSSFQQQTTTANYSSSPSSSSYDEFKTLMLRLNKEVNIKLNKISDEDIIKFVLPTKVFTNTALFDVMADESRFE